MNASQLHSLRNRLGLTLDEMAAELRIDGSTLSRYERGKRPIPENLVVLLRGANMISRRKATK